MHIQYDFFSGMRTTNTF